MKWKVRELPKNQNMKIEEVVKVRGPRPGTRDLDRKKISVGQEPRRVVILLQVFQMKISKKTRKTGTKHTHTQIKKTNKIKDRSTISESIL